MTRHRRIPKSLKAKERALARNVCQEYVGNVVPRTISKWIARKGLAKVEKAKFRPFTGCVEFVAAISLARPNGESVAVVYAETF